MGTLRPTFLVGGNYGSRKPISMSYCPGASGDTGSTTYVEQGSHSVSTWLRAIRSRSGTLRAGGGSSRSPRGRPPRRWRSDAPFARMWRTCRPAAQSKHGPKSHALGPPPFSGALVACAELTQCALMPLAEVLLVAAGQQLDDCLPVDQTTQADGCDPSSLCGSPTRRRAARAPRQVAARRSRPTGDGRRQRRLASAHPISSSQHGMALSCVSRVAVRMACCYLPPRRFRD